MCNGEVKVKRKIDILFRFIMAAVCNPPSENF